MSLQTSQNEYSMSSANLQPSLDKCQIQGGGVHLLDTLEISGHESSPSPSETYAKWTFAKRVSWENSFQLSRLNSPLKKSYEKSLTCRQVILQEGDKFHSITCRKRWCKTCCNRRTAELINGYKHLLQDFTQPTMLTLTMKNCKGRELSAYFTKSYDLLKKARRELKRHYGITVSGIATYECTYNVEDDEYHPHFNLIVDTIQAAEYILSQWLNRWGKKANVKAQFMTRLQGENDLLEAFKYVTKQAVDTEEHLKAQDWIYQTIQGKRIVRTFGTLRKAKIEAPEAVTDVVEEATSKTEIWVYQPDTRHYENAMCDTLAHEEDVQAYEAQIQARREERKKRKGRDVDKKKKPAQTS